MSIARESESWQKINNILMCKQCGFMQPMYVRQDQEGLEYHWQGCDWSGKLKEMILEK